MSEKTAISTDIREGAAVLSTRGYINNVLAELVAQESDRVAQEGIDHIVLNMAESRMVNSVGIAIILEAIEKTLERNGSFSFCGASPTIAKTFQIMGLLQLSRIYETKEEALQARGA